VRALQAKPHERIWLDVGTAEPVDFLNSTRSLHEALISKRWKEGVDLKYMEVVGGQHNPNDWAQRADRLLTFLFPRVDAWPSRR
jgi:hypothetical protein